MSAIEGKHYVITGRLEGFASQTELESRILAAGGFLDKRVTVNTVALVTNTPSSGTKKNRDAAQLGVPVITEREFCDQAGIAYTKNA